MVSPRLTHLKPRLKIGVTLGGTTASSSMTAAKGGSVSVKLGGATYTLRVPPKTLPSDTTVTLRPITKVTGIPGVTGTGVRIGPSGLDLGGAATLTTSGSSAGSGGDETTGFTSPESGDGVAEVPAEEHGGSYEQPVTHFAATGITGPDSRLDAIASHEAATAKDQFDEQGADAVRDGDLSGARDIVANSYDGYYDQVVRPLLQDSLDRDSASSASLAIYDALEYEHLAALLGADQGRSLEDLGLSSEMIDYLFRVIYRGAYVKCATGDLKGGSVGILGVVRQSQQFEGGAHEISFTDAITDVEKCYHFRLDFDSDVVETQDQGSSDLHVVAPIDVKSTANLNTGNLEYAGTGPLTYETATGHFHGMQDSCGGIQNDDVIIGSTGSTMSVNKMDFDPFHATATDPKLSVAVDPGSPTEKVHSYGTACPDGESFDEVDDESTWLFQWGSILHYSEASSSGQNGSSAPWTITTFTPGSGTLVASKTVHQEEDIQLGDDDDMGHLSEHTSLKLTHTPGPPPKLPAKPKIPPVK